MFDRKSPRIQMHSELPPHLVEAALCAATASPYGLRDIFRSRTEMPFEGEVRLREGRVSLRLGRNSTMTRWHFTLSADGTGTRLNGAFEWRPLVLLMNAAMLCGGVYVGLKYVIDVAGTDELLVVIFMAAIWIGVPSFELWRTRKREEALIGLLAETINARQT